MNDISVFKSVEGKNSILAVYDSLLEKWPVPYESRTIKTRHGDTFVIACGDKQLAPLVLLHGSSANSAMWIGDIQEYSKNFRVYAIDLPGEPGRSSDIRPDLRTSAFSDWMNDVIEELCISKASFIGISLGAWLALKFAIAYPEKVANLVLLCPAGISPQRAFLMLYAVALKPFGKWGEIRVFKKVMGTKEISDETLAYSRLISKNFTPYMGTVPIFSDDELRQLQIPIFLIVGEKDIFFHSKVTADRVKTLLPNAKIDLLSGAGHGLINQQGRILPFLRRES